METSKQNTDKQAECDALKAKVLAIYAAKSAPQAQDQKNDLDNSAKAASPLIQQKNNAPQYSSEKLRQVIQAMTQNIEQKVNMLESYSARGSYHVQLGECQKREMHFAEAIAEYQKGQADYDEAIKLRKATDEKYIDLVILRMEARHLIGHTEIGKKRPDFDLIRASLKRLNQDYEYVMQQQRLSAQALDPVHSRVFNKIYEWVQLVTAFLEEVQPLTVEQFGSEIDRLLNAAPPNYNYNEALLLCDQGFKIFGFHPILHLQAARIFFLKKEYATVFMAVSAIFKCQNPAPEIKALGRLINNHAAIACDFSGVYKTDAEKIAYIRSECEFLKTYFVKLKKEKLSFYDTLYLSLNDWLTQQEIEQQRKLELQKAINNTVPSEPLVAAAPKGDKVDSQVSKSDEGPAGLANSVRPDAQGDDSNNETDSPIATQSKRKHKPSPSDLRRAARADERRKAREEREKKSQREQKLTSSANLITDNDVAVADPPKDGRDSTVRVLEELARSIQPNVSHAAPKANEEVLPLADSQRGSPITDKKEFSHGAAASPPKGEEKVLTPAMQSANDSEGYCYDDFEITAIKLLDDAESPELSVALENLNKTVEMINPQADDAMADNAKSDDMTSRMDRMVGGTWFANSPTRQPDTENDNKQTLQPYKLF